MEFQKHFQEVTASLLDDCLTRFAHLIVENGLTQSTSDDLLTLWREKSGMTPPPTKKRAPAKSKKEAPPQPAVTKIDEVESGLSYAFIASKLPQLDIRRLLVTPEPPRPNEDVIRKDKKTGRYVDWQSKIVLDKKTHKAIGVQLEDGSLRPLSKDDVNTCITKGFEYDHVESEKVSWADEMEKDDAISVESV